MRDSHPNRNETLSIDKEVFWNLMLVKLSSGVSDFHQERVSRKFFFQCIHAAYAETLGRELATPNPLIVFHLHHPSPESAVELTRDFPDAKFLHMVREPVPTLGAWFNHMHETRQTTSVDLPKLAIELGITQAYPLLRAVSNNARAIRLEHLHNDPKGTLEKICNWLDLSWDNVLLSSTFDGKQYFVAYAEKHVTGFHTRHAGTRDNRSTWFVDRVRLKLLLADRYAEWSYDIAPAYSNTAIRWAGVLLWAYPFKMEWRIWKSPMRRQTIAMRSLIRAYLALRREIISLWVRESRTHTNLLQLL